MLSSIGFHDCAIMPDCGAPCQSRRLLNGIEDQNRSTSSNLLASVNPTFSWVRVAQRIPARIKLDNVPPDLLLAAGRTATASIGKISW
ncbi:hypothetical protein [Bradyrhizobium sp. F1.13.3]|uniref:hypothetical protein n=1 Tax=Bradyrhizobium sp. F1.13.3 TaxID=3156351 RepID=UPI003394DB0A